MTTPKPEKNTTTFTAIDIPSQEIPKNVEETNVKHVRKSNKIHFELIKKSIRDFFRNLVKVRESRSEKTINDLQTEVRRLQDLLIQEQRKNKIIDSKNKDLREKIIKKNEEISSLNKSLVEAGIQIGNLEKKLNDEVRKREELEVSLKSEIKKKDIELSELKNFWNEKFQNIETKLNQNNPYK